MGGQDIYLRVSVLPTLVKTHTFTFFVAIVVEKRSSVAPNHKAFFHLSGSLGTYSNKL